MELMRTRIIYGLAMLWFAWGGAVAAELQTVPVALAELPRVYRPMAWPRRSTAARCRQRPSGRVVEVKFDVDDMVRQGDVLVVIEDTAAPGGGQAGQRPMSRRRRQSARTPSRILCASGACNEKDAVSKADMDKVTNVLQQARAGEQVAQAALQQALQERALHPGQGPYNGIVTERLIEVGGQTAGRDGAGVRAVARQHADQRGCAAEPGRFDPQRTQGAGQDQRQMVTADVTVFPVADPRGHLQRSGLRLPRA